MYTKRKLSNVSDSGFETQRPSPKKARTCDFLYQRDYTKGKSTPNGPVCTSLFTNLATTNLSLQEPPTKASSLPDYFQERAEESDTNDNILTWSPKQQNAHISLDLAPAALTRQALRDYNKINGYPDSFRSMASDSNTKLSTSDSNRTTSSEIKEPKSAINAYKVGYVKGLRAREIYSAEHKTIKKPSNLDSMIKAIFDKRDSPELDDKTALHYRTIVAKAGSEAGVREDAVHLLFPSTDLAIDEKLCMATDFSWSRNAMIDVQIKPVLTTIKPDKTIGWHREIFTSQKAIDALGIYACPIPNPAMENLAFPLFTLEAKGDAGAIKVARLQNLHNGATMLSNLLQLKRMCGKEKNEEFFDRVHVLSLEITTESMELSCYWPTQTENDGVRFYGMVVHSWSCWSVPAFKEAHRCIRNALEWVRKEAFDWISADLALINLPSHRLQTPPSTRSHGASTAKRPRSKAEAFDPPSGASDKRSKISK